MPFLRRKGRRQALVPGTRHAGNRLSPATTGFDELRRNHGSARETSSEAWKPAISKQPLRFESSLPLPSLLRSGSLPWPPAKEEPRTRPTRFLICGLTRKRLSHRSELVWVAQEFRPARGLVKLSLAGALERRRSSSRGMPQ